ncbi:MAG: hypothetical protein JXR95_12780 [Deltaproteobacteria bacterium]|nr:hypothetical protein [Deltaproteobacteria bacterium]
MTFSGTRVYWSNLLSVSVIIAAGILFSLWNPGTDDMWWRIYSGKQITEKRQAGVKVISPTTQKEKNWINHSWLYDVVLSEVFQFSGIKGVTVLHFILLFIIILMAMLSTSDVFRTSGILLGLWLLMTHWAIRPYILGDFFLFFSMIAAHRIGTSGFPEKKFLKTTSGMFLFFLLWGNFHGSALGGFLVFSFLVFPFSSWRVSGHRYLILILISIIAICINPSGMKVFLQFIEYLTGQYSFLNHLEEWGPPNIYQMLISIFLLAMVFYFGNHRGEKVKMVILTSALFIYSFGGRRHLPLFAIVSIFYLMDFKNKNVITKRIKYGAATISMSLFLVISTPVSDDRFYPKSLLEHVNVEDPTTRSRIFTTHSWGGAVLYHFNGVLRPFVDARNDCYDEETFIAYRKIYNLENDWVEIFNSYNPSMVVFPHHPLLKKLQQHGWKVVFSGKNGKVLKKN